MAVQRLHNKGARGLAPLFPFGRVGARINGHPVYSRLLLVSRFGCPYAVVSVGPLFRRTLRTCNIGLVLCGIRVFFGVVS